MLAQLPGEGGSSREGQALCTCCSHKLQAPRRTPCASIGWREALCLCGGVAWLARCGLSLPVIFQGVSSRTSPCSSSPAKGSVAQRVFLKLFYLWGQPLVAKNF